MTPPASKAAMQHEVNRRNLKRLATYTKRSGWSSGYEHLINVIDRWTSHGNSTAHSSLAGQWEGYTSLPRLRSLSRTMQQSVAFYAAALEKVCEAVVGKSGIRVKWQPIDGELDASTADKLNDAWMRFSESEEFAGNGQHCQQELDKLIVVSLLRDGDLLLRRRVSAHSPSFISFDLFHSEYIDYYHNRQFALDEGGGKIVQGIEIDAHGRHQAYHLVQRLQHALTGQQWRQPAGNCNFLLKSKYYDDVRGAPVWAAGMKAVAMAESFDEAALAGQIISACAMLMIEQEKDMAGAPSLETNIGMQASLDERTTITGFEGDDRDEIEAIRPGGVAVLPPGSKVSSWMPGTPNASQRGQRADVMRRFSAIAGMSDPNLTQNLEGTSWSAIRSGEHSQKMSIENLQHWYVRKITRWQIKEFLAVYMDDLPVNVRMMEAGRPRIICQGQEWSDPSKEASADVMMLKAGIRCYSDIAARSGKDWMEVAANIVQERALLMKLGKEAGVNVDDLIGMMHDAGKMASDEKKEKPPDG